MQQRKPSTALRLSVSPLPLIPFSIFLFLVSFRGCSLVITSSSAAPTTLWTSARVNYQCASTIHNLSMLQMETLHSSSDLAPPPPSHSWKEPMNCQERKETNKEFRKFIFYFPLCSFCSFCSFFHASLVFLARSRRKSSVTILSSVGDSE